MPSKLNIFSKSSRSKSGNAAPNYSRLQDPRGSTESTTPLNESLNLAQEKQKAREAMRQRQAEEFLAKQGYRYGVANDNIAFDFTPVWLDAEAQLDSAAFPKVHACVVLCTTTTVSTSAKYPRPDVEVQGADVPAQAPAVLHSNKKVALLDFKDVV